MSRIGKMPIQIPEGASVALSASSVLVKGSKGELTVPIPEGIAVSPEGARVMVTRQREDRATRAIHGYVRSVLDNAVTGVTKLWTKKLELSGVGYRAATSGQSLVLTVGFSHPVMIEPPPGITLSVVEGNVLVAGIDKWLVGETAAKIRAVKPPEPYKGKGIKYQGERIRRKAGKSAKAVGGAPGGGK